MRIPPRRWGKNTKKLGETKNETISPLVQCPVHSREEGVNTEIKRGPFKVYLNC